MSLIQFEIEDKLIQDVGKKTVKEFIERQVASLRVQYLGEKIKTAIQKSGIDHQQEVKEARQEAWQEYKEKHLQDMA